MLLLMPFAAWPMPRTPRLCGQSCLGNGDAATHMGALEALGKVILEVGTTLADAIGIAKSLRENEP